MKLLLEMQYLAPVSYYSMMAKNQIVVMEACDNFKKSTYRNRCYIASPNGKLRMTIPVAGGKGQRALYSEVKIDYENGWQKNHWNSLCSCYRKSPYFEYYEDRFEPFYTERFESLFEFNRKLMELAIELLGLNIEIEYTNHYEKTYPGDVIDMRSQILPGTKSDSMHYHQVFLDRMGFIPDLSIGDLLFNKGPHSIELLSSLTNE